MGDVNVDLGGDVFMGHEFSAEVLEAGAGTEAPPAGTPVTSMPVLVSKAGVEPIIYSNTTMGGYAERMLLSAPLLLTIPNGLDPRHAALAEPMAVGLHAVNKSDIARDETALVLGCGPIGIAIIAALHNRGVETIVAADYSAKRRELAETIGAPQTVDPAQGSPFDNATPAVTFEAVGVPGSSTTCCAARRWAAGSSSPGCACNPTPCTRSGVAPRSSACSSSSCTTRPNSPIHCGPSLRARSTSRHWSPAKLAWTAWARLSTIWPIRIGTARSSSRRSCAPTDQICARIVATRPRLTPSVIPAVIN